MRGRLLTWRMASDDKTLTQYHIASGPQETADERFRGVL